MTDPAGAPRLAGPLDQLGRPVRDLRISVTDRCNLRCTYCMPREIFGPDHAFLPRAELLTFEEITHIARTAAGLGVHKLRLTGGEPLLRRDLAELVAMLAAVPGVDDVAMTTNGVLLATHAAALAAAGLRRVTVSLDALDQPTFERMADTPVPVTRILSGIAAARDAGLGVKLNTVVQRGVNEHAILDLARWGRETGTPVRFIEYMDVGTTNGWRMEEVVPAAEVVATIAAEWPLTPLPPEQPGAVADRWAYDDGAGEIGVIASVTQPFCATCVRARLSAVGELYTCLFATRGHDLRALLRGGADDAALTAALTAIWTGRTDRYSELRTAGGDPGREPGAKVEMSYIGG